MTRLQIGLSQGNIRKYGSMMLSGRDRQLESNLVQLRAEILLKLPFHGLFEIVYQRVKHNEQALSERFKDNGNSTVLFRPTSFITTGL